MSLAAELKALGSLEQATMSTSILELIDTLAQKVPAFAKARQEHIDYNGELLPYVLLEDFIASWLTVHSSEPDAASVLSILESFYSSGDEELCNAIRVCLLESLADQSRNTATRGILNQLGPNLQSALSAMNNSPRPAT